MVLDHVGYIDLPPHAKAGGFDHAAVHHRTGRVYVAHTANDAIDIIDGPARHYVESITGLPGVAGALVSDEHDLVSHRIVRRTRSAFCRRPTPRA